MSLKEHKNTFSKIQELELYSDIQTWQAFQSGDRIAFERLLNKYYSTLLNYGVRLVSNQDFAQDCLQDLFIDLWNRREHLSLPKSINAYFASSYRRRLLQEKERNFWNKKVIDLEDNYDIDVQFNIESYLINNEIEHETLLKLKHYMSTLTKRQREVLYLRFYQELEYDQISEIMSINQHSAINLVYEALKFLRKNWVMSIFLSVLKMIE